MALTGYNSNANNPWIHRAGLFVAAQHWLRQIGAAAPRANVAGVTARGVLRQRGSGVN
jgi:hypothetical protein